MFVAATALAALSTGCGTVPSLTGRPAGPLTPDQSRAQVLDAAHDIVRALQLDVTRMVFWRASCNDQHEAPFRGVVSIWYPPAPTLEASDSEVAELTRRLQADGWTADTDFTSYGVALAKHDVVAVLAPQAVGDKNRGIDLYGECRDVVTTEASIGSTEDIPLG
jgi:hypothetical protein